MAHLDKERLPAKGPRLNENDPMTLNRKPEAMCPKKISAPKFPEFSMPVDKTRRHVLPLFLPTVAKPRSIMLLLCVVFMVSGSAGAFDQGGDWQGFERMVRGGRINEGDGQKAIEAWEKRLAAEFREKGFGRDIFFPLRGYTLKDAGGRAGEGYKPAGYHFLDGNEHRGHPALDIFIHDRNHDCADDRTGRPAEVLSLADGVVLSIHTDWAREGQSRDLRGGNYIWIYHPSPEAFSYYAHLQDVFVRVGDIVEGGKRIGTLGRSGREAHPPRSATHLHLMLLRARGMKPMDPYEVLKSSCWPGDPGPGVHSMSGKPAFREFNVKGEP
jgi:hypothetical protein